jgi:hypothetical protein
MLAIALVFTLPVLVTLLRKAMNTAATRIVVDPAQ